MSEYTAYTYLPGGYDMFGRPTSKEKKTIRCKTMENGIKEMVGLLERAKDYHYSSYLELDGKYAAQMEFGPADGVYLLHRKNQKDVFIDRSGKVIAGKVYVVSTANARQRCKTFKDAVLLAARMGIGTAVKVCEPSKEMRFIIKENIFTKGNPLLVWHGSNSYYREYYTIGKDGSTRFIPYYTATVSGDNQYGDEFFKEAHFTASSKEIAKKKAIDYMERIANNNRNARVFDVTLEWHPKKFEFTRDMEKICTVDIDGRRR